MINKTNKIIPEYLYILNQIFEIEQKTSKINEKNSIDRNIQRLKNYFENIGIVYYNPVGEKYSETRTDCEASIAGESTDNLIITEVIKPIIRLNQDGLTHIIQKAVVVVETK